MVATEPLVAFLRLAWHPQPSCRAIRNTLWTRSGKPARLDPTPVGFPLDQAGAEAMVVKAAAAEMAETERAAAAGRAEPSFCAGRT